MLFWVVVVVLGGNFVFWRSIVGSCGLFWVVCVVLDH